MSGGGLLYSFRRCPYAIRARLALAAAAIPVSVREVALKAKPPELLEASAKGTVPVFVAPEGEVLEESLEIVRWALARIPGGPEAAAALGAGAQAAGTHGAGTHGAEEGAALVAECDGPFKHHLDGFRYGSAGREGHRVAALAILRRWSLRLDALAAPAPAAAGGMGAVADGLAPLAMEALGWALLPFVRQFRRTDPEAFAAEPGLAGLKGRLAAFEASAALARVMAPPWAWRHPWHSPRWLYHLALEEDWRQARRLGRYDQSTRGKGLAEVGFIHASWSHQVEATWRRFYADGPAARLLCIDPARLAAAAIPVREEPAPGSGERFPHIHGALPIGAVLLAQRWPPIAESAAP